MKKLVLSILISIITVITVFAAELETVKINTSAECDECKITIEEAVNDLSGVDSCSLDVPTKVLTVTYLADDIDLATIREAINRAGYDADDTKATKRGLRNLPDCCKPGGMKK